MWNEIIQYALIVGLLAIIIFASSESYNRDIEIKDRIRYLAGRIDSLRQTRRGYDEVDQ